jgi:hypothetical protein
MGNVLLLVDQDQIESSSTADEWRAHDTTGGGMAVQVMEEVGLAAVLYRDAYHTVEQVKLLRSQHPRMLIVVTGPSVPDAHRDAVIGAGADCFVDLEDLWPSAPDSMEQLFKTSQN